MAHIGFSKLKAMLEKEKGVKDAGATAASIGMKKYGKKKFEKAAHEGKSMEHMKPKGK